jgi:asparagine synthase (glutamine-hydrolysing)
MCGVLAIFDPRQAAERFATADALNALAHRGPDGESSWISTDHRCFLGHRRLAMVDVTYGQQPLVTVDGRFACVVNGELYDRDDALRRALIRTGASFRSNSDSELLLHLFAQIGTDAFAQLRGEYAAIVIDQRERVLYCARDPSGIKPLVYAVIDGALCIASEAKALFALGHTPRWSRDAIRFATQWQYLLPQQTLFDGVHLLPHGQLLSACFMANSQVSVRTSSVRWRPHFEQLLEQEFGDRRDESALLGLLRESVHLRVRGDAKLAAYLSGGIDSSTVAALAQECQPELDVFTLGFSHGASESQAQPALLDEVELARAFASSRGFALHVVDNSPLELVENTAPAAVASEGLTINGHLAAKWKLSRAVSRAGFKGVLVGEGADELFLGYAHLLVDWLEHQGVGTQSARARFGPEASVMLATEHTAGLHELACLLGRVPSWIEAKFLRAKSLTKLLDPASVFRDDAEAVTSLVHGLSDTWHSRSPPRDAHPVALAARSWSDLALSSYILKTLGDGTEMAHGVEGRVPFLDPLLASFASSLSVEKLLSDAIEKGFLRRAVAPVVGPTIAARPKRALVTPFAATSEVAFAAMRELLLAQNALPLWVNRARVEAWLDKLATIQPTERASHDGTLFTLLSASALQQHFGL